MQFNEGNVDTLASNLKFDHDAHFYSIDSTLYVSVWNDATYRLTNDNTFELYNNLIVFDETPVSERTYLCAIQNSWIEAPQEYKKFSGAVLMSNTPIDAQLYQYSKEECNQSYYEYGIESNHIDLEYCWSFEGAVPDISSSINPSVKYINPGDFAVNLSINNRDGDTIRLEYNVFCGRLL